MQQLTLNSLFAVSEIEISYKNKVRPNERVQISNSSTAHEVLKEAWDMNKIELIEQFKIILMDHSNKCLGVSEMSTGGIAMCPVDRKIIFATALKARASKIICAHNHPSGNLTPSQQDIDLTKILVQAGKIIDVEVIEHIIVTPQGYYSFADNGLIP